MKIENRNKNHQNEQNGYLEDIFVVDKVAFTFVFNAKISYSNESYLSANARKGSRYYRYDWVLLTKKSPEKEIENFKMEFVKKALKSLNEKKTA